MWKLQLLAKTHHLITSVNTKLEKRSFFYNDEWLETKSDWYDGL